MRQVLSYNIHNILTFQVIRNRKFGFRDLLDLRFSCFQVEQVEKPDIVLNIGRFTPSNEDCYLVDHKYYIKDNYFYCRESGGKASWEVEIRGFERGDTTINCHSKRRFQVQPVNLARSPMIVALAFLTRAIEYRLAARGGFLTHAGAVGKSNQAYLLSGRGGCFKTSLCMDFVRRAGFTCLGEDRVILYQDKVLGFPTNSALFEFVTKRLRDETHFGVPQQIRFVAEYLRGRDGGGSEDRVKSAKLNAVLLIAKRSRSHATGQVNFEPLSDSSLDEIVDSLLLNTRLDDFISGGMNSLGVNSAPFLRYMLAYTFVFPNSLVATQERKLAESLRSSLEKIPIYRVEIPHDYSPDTFNQIHRFIDKNC